MKYENKLDELKDEIKDIDVKLVLLLNQRADFSTELNNLKNKMGLPLYDKVEEMEIMDIFERNLFNSNINKYLHNLLKSFLDYCELCRVL